MVFGWPEPVLSGPGLAWLGLAQWWQAVAIADKYPSPRSLVHAFRVWGEEALASLQPRGDGKRLGPCLSKRIHRFVMATDAATLIE